MPRSEAQAGSTPSRARLTDNTNLEDVSDWLTKILIGIGIAEFDDIVTYLGEIGDLVGQGMGGEGLASGNKIIAVSSILYGFVCGFLFYYFWARVSFLKLLKDAHQESAGAPMG